MMEPRNLYRLQRISLLLSRHRVPRVVSELLRRRFVRTPVSLLTASFDHDLKFMCDLQEHIGSSIFWKGSYSRDILQVLDPLLAEGMTFIDVGANQGEFTLFAAKRLRQGRVIAFEPTSYIFKKLVSNVELNGFTNVDLVPKALSDKPGQAPIYLPRERFSDGSLHWGLSSLYRTADDAERMESVTVTTLDDYIGQTRPARVDIMKIDIEGSELFMLRGAVRTLETFRPVLIVEIASDPCRAAGYDAGEILKFIASHGYRAERIMRGGVTRPIGDGDPAAWQNVICRPA